MGPMKPGNQAEAQVPIPTEQALEDEVIFLAASSYEEVLIFQEGFYGKKAIYIRICYRGSSG